MYSPIETPASILVDNVNRLWLFWKGHDHIHDAPLVSWAAPRDMRTDCRQEYQYTISSRWASELAGMSESQIAEVFPSEIAIFVLRFAMGVVKDDETHSGMKQVLEKWSKSDVRRWHEEHSQCIPTRITCNARPSAQWGNA